MSYLQVSPELVTPNATESARKLMHYLTRQYGRHTLAGQQEKNWVDQVHLLTGKYPAVLGVDYIDFSASRIGPGRNS